MTVKSSYEDRLIVPCSGMDDAVLYSRDAIRLAKGYERIVIGGRGPYVEFNDEQIDWDNFSIPKEEEYRIDSRVVFYTEYRSHGDSNVKLYHQKKNVIYAGYRIGMNYITPFELYLAPGEVLIEKLKKTNELNDRQQALFG